MNNSKITPAEFDLLVFLVWEDVIPNTNPEVETPEAVYKRVKAALNPIPLPVITFNDGTRRTWVNSQKLGVAKFYDLVEPDQSIKSKA